MDITDAAKQAQSLANRIKSPLLFAERLTSGNAPHHRWYLLFHLRECQRMAAELEAALKQLAKGSTDAT